MAQQKLNPSGRTIAALINSMIGSAMLTMPVLFLKSGIVTGLIILAISGFISYKTCRIYVIHLSKKENDVDDTILRIIGKQWFKFFKIVTGFYLVLLNIVYIELINDQIYDIIYFIMKQNGYENSIAAKGIKALVFDQFSVQYLSLILFVPLLAIIFIRNLNFLVKLTSLGVVSVFIYTIFLIYQFADNIGHADFSQLPWFGLDIGNLAGTSALAFTVHTVVASIVKNNQNQQKNQRDLKVSYILGFLIYSFIGVCGSIAIIGNTQCKVTIVDCFIDKWEVLLVQSGYLFALITLYPCFLQVGRNRLLLSFYPEVTQKMFKIFNVTFALVATLFVFLSPYLPLDEVMNLIGSIICFIFIYLIPIKLHFSCFYKITSWKSLFFKQQLYETSLLGSSVIDTDQINDTQSIEAQNQCSHSPKECKKHTKTQRIIFYGVIFLYGLVIGVYGLVMFFKNLFD